MKKWNQLTSESKFRVVLLTISAVSTVTLFVSDVIRTRNYTFKKGDE